MPARAVSSIKLRPAQDDLGEETAGIEKPQQQLKQAGMGDERLEQKAANTVSLDETDKPMQR